MSKPLLEIYEMREGEPFAPVMLDRESRKYLHVTVNNIEKRY